MIRNPDHPGADLDLMSWDDLWLPEVDTSVDAVAGIDPWCSSPTWAASANRAFDPESTPLLVNAPGLGRALLCRYELEIETDEGQQRLRTIAGLEPMWGFACPILTTDPIAYGPVLAGYLSELPDWDQVILPGFPDDLRYLRLLARGLHDHGFDLGATPGIVRQVADLTDGFDPYIARRRPNFRRNLRNAQRRVQSAAIRFIDASDDAHLITRLQKIERRSWKGRDDDGICSPQMAEFYRTIIARLQPEGRIRATIAVQHGNEVGFILGGTRGGRYRGLQLSYAEEAADLSLSHVLQLREIEALCDADISTYDLGMDMEYKRRWSDRQDGTVVMSVVPPRSDRGPRR